jgi:hypothetical protein
MKAACPREKLSREAVDHGEGNGETALMPMSVSTFTWNCFMRGCRLKATSALMAMPASTGRRLCPTCRSPLTPLPRSPSPASRGAEEEDEDEQGEDVHVGELRRAGIGAPKNSSRPMVMPPSMAPRMFPIPPTTAATKAFRPRRIQAAWAGCCSVTYLLA